MKDNYGPLKANCSYVMLDQKNDWYIVRHNGKNYCVSKDLINDSPWDFLTENLPDDPDNEVELDENFIFLD